MTQEHEERMADPARDVEVLWDCWGVPHVLGSNEAATGYGFGWSQARAHGDLLLRLYGQARGRAAEYWGTEFLDGDRLVATMGFGHKAQEWLASQSPRFRPVVEAFAEGINDCLAADPGAAGPASRRVLPVAAEDVLAHTLRTYLTFLTVNGQQGQGVDPHAPRYLDVGLPLPPGSNGWAIGPTRSRSGRALLLANPHLAWSDLYTFFEAHLRAPGLDASGIALVGLPVLMIGFNDDLGWTHTVNTHDGWDVYQLLPDGQGYVVDGVSRAFDTTQVTPRVRQPDGALVEEEHRIRRSVHGPVVAETDAGPVALRVVAVDQVPVPGLLEQYWDMAAARDLETFETVLGRMQLPMSTVLYADCDGHILNVFAGLSPRRPEGDWAMWSRLVPGDRSDLIWHDVLDYEELRVVDPDTGWLQNSNSPPWYATYPPVLRPEDFPADLAPDFLTLREQRCIQLLRCGGPSDLDTLLACKFDTHVTMADRVLDDLLAAATASPDERVVQAGRVLAAWDRRTDPDSRGAVLFLLWFLQTGAAGLRAEELFARPWSREEPLDTPTGLGDPQAAAAALARAAATATAVFGALDVPWGSVFRLRRDSGDHPGRGGPGDPLGIVQFVAYAPLPAGWSAVAGDTEVLAVEFTRPPTAQAVLTYGNWSRPGSHHASDQLELYAHQRTRPVLRRLVDIDAHLERRQRPMEIARLVGARQHRPRGHSW